MVTGLGGAVCVCSLRRGRHVLVVPQRFAFTVTAVTGSRLKQSKSPPSQGRTVVPPHKRAATIGTARVRSRPCFARRSSSSRAQTVSGLAQAALRSKADIQRTAPAEPEFVSTLIDRLEVVDGALEPVAQIDLGFPAEFRPRQGNVRLPLLRIVGWQRLEH